MSWGSCSCAGTILGKGKPQARLSRPAVHCRAAERRDKQTGLFQRPCRDRLWRTLCTTQSFERLWRGQSKGLSFSLRGCFATSRCLIEVDLNGTRALMTEQTPFGLWSTETWETPVTLGLLSRLCTHGSKGRGPVCTCKLANLRDRRGSINFQPQPHGRIRMAGKPSVGAERYVRRTFQETGDRKMPEWFISPITNTTSLRCGALARSTDSVHYYGVQNSPTALTSDDRCCSE